MKKLFYVGALSALLLAACGGEEAAPAKEETKEVETKSEASVVEEVVETVESEAMTDAQMATIEAFKSNNFKTFADAFYALEAAERSAVYSEAVEAQSATWTGIITDLESIGDSVVMIEESLYDGATWQELNDNTPEKVPYVIIVEMANEADKQGLKVGDAITLKGEIGARGDKGFNYNWKLYEGEIVK